MCCRCRRPGPIAPIVRNCHPFHATVDLIIVLIALQFLCGIFNGDDLRGILD
ncbi:MAG: hypothetical protein ACOX2Q_00360 [Dehalobacterium sp.]|jgi:hypothetical protein